ncbi:S-adenosylmethionine:tRNA ribosyltransferase-isomerase [Fictibacillus phosphorivorans]|uniref:S-adenosylmethionine:tRNA ribosyltransferase-isomerase n=1 Tax=Fictibacillus phosphorivorans TaxID=1221500 RepID=UPI00203E6DFE|nr:S-adenosylmethionine:tRNA ribosyltransferase-isomerase [Fictibacillus phosphorivorans]MCM3719410.1 S-adenosylmethionine:tRNA ribosyltransferase-isomerase [Fictibacillus phosphorivorans]MCM3777112.1 S-adenosylmethionine:tRNA ribosyltransferase-isomerase [Fictibacillus phosphorivorans]
MESAMKFELPQELNAKEPPERRGLRRDYVKMMVLNKTTGQTEHTKFYQLDRYLKKGDLLVLNVSRTVPAVLKSIREIDGTEVEVRLAHRKNESLWEALPVSGNLVKGDVIRFSPTLTATVVEQSSETPFVSLAFSLCCSSLYNQIYSLGEPVRYEYIQEPWNLDYYQTVFATIPGSVEMPSAGRAFSWELLFRLQKKGVRIAYITLHTGLSYLLDDKWQKGPDENFENYEVSEETVNLIHETKKSGGRVVAVGTTVVRALETVALKKGRLQAHTGWTNLYITKDTKLQICDGLITGMHEPEASHLQLLSAFVDQDKLYEAYQGAIEQGYLWHEFGDMNLIL